ncbi:MAG: CvpA family protein [Proteiniphilum sp.]|jgi:membrane protein required for colicin V production|nr:CvpA family protein [Proteiniphilum sp.]MDD2937083.1 CvpA family protein [Proteiniphilum sp.]MDD3778987.1 CvpA family protein [Proteiniphilum sp.]MDD3955420.1 CvpA family protein [Proteiniphilum sp.]MDD4451302.1 CvpA family protein [Proteiniphilum sp.]
MNWFDVLVGMLLLIAFINGYRKGLIMQLVGLATIVLAAIFGGRIAERIFPEIIRLIDISPASAKVLAFVLAFALIAILLSLIGRLIQKFVDVVMLSFINRLLGSVISMGTMMFFLSILLNLILVLDKKEVVINRKTKQESFFFERVEAVVPAVIPYMNKELWEEYIPRPYIEELEKKSDSTYRDLPEGALIDSVYQQKHFNVD